MSLGLVSLSLMFALASEPDASEPTPDSASPSVPAPTTREPSVDTSELGDLGVLIAPKVIDATLPLLQEAQIDPGDVSILITFRNPDEFEYAIRVVLDPAKDVKTAPFKACRGCMTTELVETTQQAVKKAIERQQARQDKMPIAAAEEAAPESTSRSTSNEDKAPPKRRALGPLGWAGIGTLGLGIASTATGVGFVVVGETRPEEDKSQLRDFRPSGYGLLGVGGALVVTGVALIVADRLRAKKSARGKTAAMPVFAPGHAGFAIIRQF